MDTVHVGDIGTVIYLPTAAGGQPLGDTLETFTTRTVCLMRPGLAALLDITEVPIEVDPADSVKKLKLMTGTETGLVLTGTGDFALRDADVGDWYCSITLAHATGQWSDGPLRLFRLARTRPALTVVPLAAPGLWAPPRSAPGSRAVPPRAAGVRPG